MIGATFFALGKFNQINKFPNLARDSQSSITYQKKPYTLKGKFLLKRLFVVPFRLCNVEQYDSILTPVNVYCVVCNWVQCETFFKYHHSACSFSFFFYFIKRQYL